MASDSGITEELPESEKTAINGLLQVLEDYKRERGKYGPTKTRWGWYTKKDKDDAVDALVAVLKKAELPQESVADKSLNSQPDKAILKVLKDGDLGNKLSEFIGSKLDELNKSISWISDLVKPRHRPKVNILPSHEENSSAAESTKKQPPAKPSGFLSCMAKLFCCCSSKSALQAVPKREPAIS